MTGKTLKKISVMKQIFLPSKERSWQSICYEVSALFFTCGTNGISPSKSSWIIVLLRFV